MTPPQRPGQDDTGRTPPTPRGGRWRGRGREDMPVAEEETGWIDDLRQAQQSGAAVAPDPGQVPPEVRRTGGLRAGASRIADGFRPGRPTDERRPDGRPQGVPASDGRLPAGPGAIRPDGRNSDVRGPDPRIQDQRAQDPRAQDPRAQDPRSQEPRVQDPRGQDPRGVDPRGRDVRGPVARLGDARPVDVRPGDSRPGDTRLGDGRPGELRPADARSGGVRPLDRATDVRDQGDPDVGRPPTGRLDTGRPDVGRLDTGRPDTGRPDVGRPEAGRPDSARLDGGSPDVGRLDAGRLEAGRPEAGKLDDGRLDDVRLDDVRLDDGRREPDFGGPSQAGRGSGVPASPDASGPRRRFGWPGSGSGSDSGGREPAPDRAIDEDARPPRTPLLPGRTMLGRRAATPDLDAAQTAGAGPATGSEPDDRPDPDRDESRFSGFTTGSGLRLPGRRTPSPRPHADPEPDASTDAGGKILRTGRRRGYTGVQPGATAPDGATVEPAAESSADSSGAASSSLGIGLSNDGPAASGLGSAALGDAVLGDSGRHDLQSLRGEASDVSSTDQDSPAHGTDTAPGTEAPRSTDLSRGTDSPGSTDFPRGAGLRGGLSGLGFGRGAAGRDEDESTDLPRPGGPLRPMRGRMRGMRGLPDDLDAHSGPSAADPPTPGRPGGSVSVAGATASGTPVSGGTGSGLAGRRGAAPDPDETASGPRGSRFGRSDSSVPGGNPVGLGGSRALPNGPDGPTPGGPGADAGVRERPGGLASFGRGMRAGFDRAGLDHPGTQRRGAPAGPAGPGTGSQPPSGPGAASGAGNGENGMADTAPGVPVRLPGVRPGGGRPRGAGQPPAGRMDTVGLAGPGGPTSAAGPAAAARAPAGLPVARRVTAGMPPLAPIGAAATGLTGPSGRPGSPVPPVRRPSVDPDATAIAPLPIPQSVGRVTVPNPKFEAYENGSAAVEPVAVPLPTANMVHRPASRGVLITLFSIIMVILVVLPGYSLIRDGVSNPGFRTMDALGVPAWADEGAHDATIFSRFCIDECQISERDTSSTHSVTETAAVYTTRLKAAGWKQLSATTCTGKNKIAGSYTCWTLDAQEFDLWVRPACTLPAPLAQENPLTTPSPAPKASSCAPTAVQAKIFDQIERSRVYGTSTG